MFERSEVSMLSSPLHIQDSSKDNQEVSEVSQGSKEPITSDDEAGPVTRRKRATNFSDSDSDLDKGSKDIEDNGASPSKSGHIVNNDSISSFNNVTKKSRIKHIDDTSESENSFSEGNKQQKKSLRSELKMKRLKDKFKGLISHQLKSSQEVDAECNLKLPNSDVERSEKSDEEVTCLNVKQKVQKSAYLMKSICDPDTSDEESNTITMHKKVSKPKPRRTKPTSPKPMRMSAKQAMENMHKIKSESNRMLREKQVSLPYHRPKALSLKDILSRRKTAVTSDGKALPIKMNNDQLKQYVSLLEQRQKEVIELCKSDTEEEEEEDCPEDEANVKNCLSIDTTMDVEKELGLEANTNVAQIFEATNADFHNYNNCTDGNQESITKSQNTEQVNSSLNNETSCNESNNQENIVISQNAEEVHANSNKETCCIENSAKETINYRNQTVSLMGTEMVNQPIIIDLDKKHDETAFNISKKNNKKQKLDLMLEKSSEKQSVDIPERCTERESQNMKLHYDSEKAELIQESEHSKIITSIDPTTSIEKQQTELLDSDDGEFLDNDFNYDEIDKLIENAEIACDGGQKSSTHENAEFVPNPKLTGAPGMVIDLDNNDPLVPKQLSGVDLLKERFTYFAKLKSLEDMEKDREKKFKPGVQHLKLKRELEDRIAEQRSMEWEKRLEEEKRLKSEINGHFSGDDIEKLEAKLEDIVDKVDNESSEGETEPEENDVILEDKPKNRNPMVDDEAEESEGDEEICGNDNEDKNFEMDNADDGDEADLEDDDETSDSSSESEDDIESKPRKGRILKAFEDSDDESTGVKSMLEYNAGNSEITGNIVNVETSKKREDSDIIKDSQDVELHLAQGNKSSDDLFTTQDSDKPNLIVAALNKISNDNVSADLGTQTFSILGTLGANQTVNLNSPEKTPVCRTQTLKDDLNLLIGACPDKFSSQTTLPEFSQTQEFGDDVVALCTGKFYDNPFISQDDKTEKVYSPVKSIVGSQTQEFGDDTVALCTGKFNDNPFVSQYGENSEINKLETLQATQKDNDIEMVTKNDTGVPNINAEGILTANNVEKSILNSILEDLDGPDFEQPKNKYFPSEYNERTNKEHNLVKKKLVIDSDDETNDGISQKKIKKLRKRKAEDRALQISDDEEEEADLKDQTDIESDMNEDEERIVEYDSEENEVEVRQKTSKKKRIGAFFENEAELTSEDEWVGSGDEDERGLDRMEREEGDDETFHQGQLQREIGQIHMREVLDQDKREVRMIQELLFEDGDLGDGHRQRKFRWKNADGEEETGTNPNEFLDTQEEEFESEEQWRKQRHEREMFLRNLQEKDETDLNTSINRTAIIKANLCSRSMSTLLSETNRIQTKAKAEKDDTTATTVTKTARDVSSPKKSFTIFQQNYHGSLLTRGRGALARLAALATPLVTDNDDAPKNVTSSNRRNFVFTALSQDEKPKVTKRKADANVNTPKLIKKLKTDDPNKHYKSTLFDHLKSC